jgi:GT2 family glycosyltransferase
MLAQDYPALEYKVLDDGSTDTTPAVLASYTGRVDWERQANMGQSRTLNKGWQAAKGDYLGYLSSDDLLLPHALSALVAALEADPTAVVVYCDFDLIDAQGKVVGHVDSPDYSQRQMEEDLMCHPGPGALFRRSAFEKVGGWDPTLRKVPDFEFWLRMGRQGHFIRVPKVLAHYRVHAESASVRPVPVESTMEIVNTMRAHWGEDQSPAARRALASAYTRAAKSHAQSGRPWAALKAYGASVKYRPKNAVSQSAWSSLFSGFAMHATSRWGRIAAKLR